MKRELSDTKHQQRMECYKKGMTDKEAATACGIATTSYRDWRCKHRLVINLSRRDYKFNNEGRIVKDDHYEPTGREMPPTHKSECITIVSDNKMVVEDYLERFGNRVEPIKMPLSEANKPFNLKGKIVGFGFHRNNRLGQI